MISDPGKDREAWKGEVGMDILQTKSAGLGIDQNWATRQREKTILKL